ncbi:hypothetical protein [Dactylosporangium sp. CA-139066]|uniref:hypothetical protein n=1 Tax=Dactylosporangium sp. CA-139066 TaxID=3239930 RepID=UPI003D8C9B95
MDDRLTALRDRLTGLSGAARIQPLLELGQALADRYWRTGPGRPAGRPDLDAAIEACREAHRLLDPAAAVRGNVAANTGWLLGIRYTVHGSAQPDREAAITLLEEALSSATVAPVLAAMARVVVAQLYLGRVVEELRTLDAGRLMNGARPTTGADADRAAARLREVLAGPAMNAEITTAAEGMLPMAEALETMLAGLGGGGLPTFDLDRLAKAMAAAEKLRRGMGGVPPAASSTTSPAPFLSAAIAAADPLDYPVAVVRDASPPKTATVPRPRPAPPPSATPSPATPPPAAPAPADAARAAARRRLSSLAGAAGAQPWEQALSVLLAGPGEHPRAVVDAFAGAAANAVDLAGEPDGVDHLVLATALYLRDDDDRDAAAEHLQRAAELIPDGHPAAAAVTEAFGAFADADRPFAGPAAAAVPALRRGRAALRANTSIDVGEMVRAADALPAGHRLRAALARAAGQARLAAAVRTGDPAAIRAAAAEVPSPFARAIVALADRDDAGLRAAAAAIAPEAGSPAVGAVLGALRLHPEADADLDAVIAELQAAAVALDAADEAAESGLRTRTWRRLAAAYRRRGAAGDAGRARAAAIAALRGADQDPAWAARFAGWLLADGRAEDAFAALEVAAGARARPGAGLGEDVVAAMTGVAVAGAPRPETPSAGEVAGALRAMGAAALVYVHPTDEAGRTVGVLCLDATTEQLDVAANVPVTDPLVADDPTWPAIVERWREQGRRARILVAAGDGPAGIPLAAARIAGGRRVAEEFDVSRVAGGAEAVRLSRRELRPIAVEPVFVVNPRGDREADMIDVMVLRRMFYPRSVCLGLALEPVDGAGRPADLTARLPKASLVHLACGVRGAALELAGDQELPAAAIGAASGLAILPATAHAGFTAIADALLAAGCTGVAGWLRPVDPPVAALAQFMLHLALVVEGSAPATAVGAVQRWMINPDRTVPPDLPAPLAAVARGTDLTVPALWASLTYRGR